MFSRGELHVGSPFSPTRGFSRETHSVDSCGTKSQEAKCSIDLAAPVAMGTWRRPRRLLPPPRRERTTAPLRFLAKRAGLCSNQQSPSTPTSSLPGTGYSTSCPSSSWTGFDSLSRHFRESESTSQVLPGNE